MIPKIVVELWNIWTEGKSEEPTKLQAVVSSENWL